MDEKRRDFLKKAGKVAVYTPPAMLAVAHPSLEAIARSGCNNGVGNGPDCPPPGIEKNGKVFLDNDDVYGTPGNPQNRGGFN